MSAFTRLAVISSAILVGLTGNPLPAVGQILEEVVVTAQRREQNVLDVPVSIDLLTEAELESINDVRDLYQVSPSVTFVSGVASSTQAINIRGVGGGAHVSAFEPSVAIVLDQVSAGPGGAALTEFWDVDRIEVLNGPQGTLFGKNVSAGLVSIVTKDPTDEFGGKLGLRWENEYEEYRVEGMINGPLSDNWNGRFSFYGLEQDKGLLENVTRGTEDNTKARWGARGKLAFDNDENFTLDASLSFERQDNECCSRAITALDPEVLAAPGLLNLLASLFLAPSVDASGIVVNDDNVQTINDSYAFEDTETVHGVLEMSWELANGHTVNSITGYRTWDQAEWNDVDSYPGDFIRGGLTHDMTLFTQEVQYLSPTGGDLEYMLGFYYYNMDLDEQTILEGCSDVCTALGILTQPPFFMRSTWTSNVQTENIAAFGHATYKFSDKWVGFAGARLLREDLDVTGQLTGNFIFWPVGEFPTHLATTSDTDWMGTFGVQYYSSDDTMFYGSYSRGYKGAGINNSINSTIFAGDTQGPVLNPETVNNFEFGVKTTLFDDRAALSATLFFAEYEDFQASAFDGSSGFVLKNAGVVQSTGVELNFDGNLWDGGGMSLNVAYVDAEFDEFLGAPCSQKGIAAGTCDAAVGQDLSGSQVNRSPKLRFSIAGQQDFDVGGKPAYVRVDYMWRDSNILDGDLDPNTFQDSYGLLNARISMQATENVEIALWGRNLTDETYALTKFDVPLFSGAYGQYPGKQRQLGVEVIATF